MAKRVGRPRKYPIDHLVVGQFTIIPWRLNKKGERIDQQPILNAICQEQRRFQKTFSTEATAIGLKVKRVR